MAQPIGEWGHNNCGAKPIQLVAKIQESKATEGRREEETIAPCPGIICLYKE